MEVNSKCGNSSAASSNGIAVVHNFTGKCSLRLKRRVALPEKRLSKGGVGVFSDVVKEEEENYSEELIDIEEFCSSHHRRQSRGNSMVIKNQTSGLEEPFIDVSSIDSEEMERICLLALGTVLHHHSTDIAAYVSYIKEILQLPDAKFNALYDKAKQRESTGLQLVCCVQGANLHPKDAKSLPDVICHLAVFPSKTQADRSLYSQNMADWKEGGVIDVMKRTGFAPATLLPVWNQTFKLILKDPTKEMIVAEIWGRKNKAAHSSAKKTMEYYKKSDNFIGRAFYLLKTTPTDGEDKTLVLYSHSGKHKRGSVDLQLTINDQLANIPLNVFIRDHTLLLQLIVHHESRLSGGYIMFWDAWLNNMATEILSKHMELTGISRLQEKCIWLHVFLEYHKLHHMKLVVLAAIVEDIVTCLPALTDDQIDQLWVKQLLFEMRTLLSLQLKLLKGHLVNFNIKAADDLSEIACSVKILELLYSFAPFLKKLKETEKDLTASIEICIQVAVPNWFLELSKNMLTPQIGSIRQSADGDMELVALKGICKHCLKHAQRAFKTMNPIFQSVGVDYFSSFFLILDKLLCGDVMPRMQLLSRCLDDQVIYEIYLVFKDLADLVQHVCISKRDKVEITDFYKFFVSRPLSWIDLATHKCKEMIEKAISLDERINSELDHPKFSSSAVDTGGLLLQLGLFWQNLEWPMATDAFGFLCTIIEQISQLSLFYVDALYKSLLMDSSIMYDKTGRFQSSERLCTILNNMYHVKITLFEMPDTLKLESYYSWLEHESNGLGTKAKKLVETLLSSHDEDIENKISYFVDGITERLAPDISHFFEFIVPVTHGVQYGKHIGNLLKSYSAGNESSSHGIQWPWQNKETGEHLSNEDAITPLLKYLSTNLQILGDYLLSPVFNCILHRLWNVVIGVVQARLVVIPRRPSVLYLYKRLEYFMFELKDFFHADGDGMSLTDLGTDAYQFIIEKLNLLQTLPRELLTRFLSELGQQQQQQLGASIRQQGTLQLSIGYLLDKHVIEVSIIQAKNLTGKAQLSSYVEVFLLPDWLFPKSAKKIRRTAVVKGTVNPFYGEEFQLPAEEENLTKCGTVLVMFVINKESSNIIGITVVNVAEIPLLYAHVNSLAQEENFPERKNSTLPLFTQRESAVLKEIEARREAHDQEVIDFHKSNKRLFEKTTNTQ